MLMQTDLFTSENSTDAGAAMVVAPGPGAPIVVPCGFRNRRNNPCQRLGNWPIMEGAKQMLCRDRPMVHCDAACFRGDPPPPAHEAGGDDVLWGDREGEYGDDQ
jgi:hypothetical protein